jgi:two-component system OmpR family sensor kinase/two-component system sensor histidine kinase BaeS
LKRLWVRLTLAFIITTLVTVITVAVATIWSVGQELDQYLARPDLLSGSLLQTLQEHYRQHGSWEGVADLPDLVKSSGPVSGFPAIPQMRWLLADAQGRIVYADRPPRLDQKLTTGERRRAQPISVDNAVVGYLVAEPPASDTMDPSARSFRDHLQQSILLAALGAMGLGLGLGLLISRSVAAPLATLAQTARAFAACDWTQRVPIKDTARIAEVSEVALAFNDMADSLQQAETLRRNLMADVAHELRTPLTVMQGLLGALLDGVHPLEIKEIAILYDETRLLARLVEDVRELALAEAKQMPFTMQAVDVGTLLQATAARFVAAADAQQVTLEVDTPAALARAKADPDRMAQVLQNLVSNALRHTPVGERITLAAQTRAAHVQVSVSDTGAGIAPQDLPYVFDRFYRGEGSWARTSGNSGLGLSIAKALVEGMGGTIGVESTPGEGSRFWFTLPLA